MNKAFLEKSFAFLVIVHLFANTTSAQNNGFQEVATIENITEYRMKNGLKVLLYPDPSTSKVTVNATVFVGSRHEGYGEAGMAHLLEHMVFKGTKQHPDIPKALKDRGAILNGTTWVDRTNYFETLPADGDNLEFAIRLEADRLFNSLIRREDLASEMTVVRNEFERGENDPERILSQRMISAAFEWHNYGKSTIGNRADIERVPIEQLQAFYKKYYRVDNIMLVVAGKFQKDQALQLIAKYFGNIQAPATPLPSTYTEEPPQDGQRQVVLRRVGKVGSVGVVYHIPAGSHPDFPALEILGDVLSSQPSGILYKNLVGGKIGTSVYAFAFGWHDPGVFEIMLNVEPNGNIDQAKAKLLETIEQFKNSPPNSEEVQRAKVRFERNRSLLMADSNRIGISLSDWAAKGDWRLFFLHRDLIAKVTPADVERVAKAYLNATNSTVGIYYPTEKADRASIPAAPDLSALMKDYKGGKSMAQGEFFDPSIENIEKRVSTGKISDNVNFAFLPRKTRNEVVNILLNIHYGNESALTGKNTPASLIPSLLARGTKNKSRQQLEDALAALKAQWRATGSVGEIQVSIVCQRESVAKVMDLLQEVLREPSFPVEEFEIIKRQSKDLLEKSKTEPGALASRLLQRKLDPQPESNIRYIPTVEESMSRLEKTSIEDIRNLYSSTVGVGEAELVAVGDFDPAILQEKAKSILANWKAGVPYARIERAAKTTIKGEKVIIETPDKENAMFLTGFAFGMKDTDPDFAALEVADFILGGGTLSSRLGNRVRQKEGLAYGIRSFFNSEALDNSSRFQVMASCNPTKVANVDKAVFEELKLLIEKGIDPKEFSESQKALLAQWKIERSSDSRIAGILAENLSAKRNMDFYRNLEKQVETLTPQQVVDAFKKHIDPGKMITIWAGDFKKGK